MCCTKSYFTRCQKVIKHASSTTKGFQVISIEIIQHQKGYPVYVTSTQKIFSSHDVVFEKYFIARYHTLHVHIKSLL